MTRIDEVIKDAQQDNKKNKALQWAAKKAAEKINKNPSRLPGMIQQMKQRGLNNKEITQTLKEYGVKETLIKNSL